MQTLQEDPELPKYLKSSDLTGFFDIDYYLRNVGAIFRRMGL